MNNRENIDKLFVEMANEVLSFIKSSETGFNEGWVPATYVRERLNLTKNAYPQGNKTDNKTGWLFATLARHLQDNDEVSYKKVGSRAFYRSR